MATLALTAPAAQATRQEDCGVINTNAFVYAARVHCPFARTVGRYMLSHDVRDYPSIQVRNPATGRRVRFHCHGTGDRSPSRTTTDITCRGLTKDPPVVRTHLLYAAG